MVFSQAFGSPFGSSDCSWDQAKATKSALGCGKCPVHLGSNSYLKDAIICHMIGYDLNQLMQQYQKFSGRDNPNQSDRECCSPRRCDVYLVCPCPGPGLAASTLLWLWSSKKSSGCLDWNRTDSRKSIPIEP